MDGVIASEPLVNTVYFNPSIDAIEEVKVQTGSYSAEYGMNNGANVQIALKSGTNEFHGAFFEFLRNDAADAKDYFLNFQLPAGTPLQSKNRLRRNQFGTWLAGPGLLPKIYNGKDRTFWSFNYEGTRETQESVQQAFWFPQAFRNGDFSALLDAADPQRRTDPGTDHHLRSADRRAVPRCAGQHHQHHSRPAASTRTRRTSSTNTCRCRSSPRQDILDTNVIATVPNILYQNQYFARLDHQFSAKDRIFGRFATMKGDYVDQQHQPELPKHADRFRTTTWPSSICTLSARPLSTSSASASTR